MRFHICPLLLRFIPVILLAGCTSNLEKLKEIKPQASDFHSSLAAEYLAYSESEIEQGRNSSADYYAAKGVRASNGEEVEPDQVNPYSADVKKLASARYGLTNLLSEDVKNVEPQKAARTQLLFDCWNGQENDAQSVIKNSCASEFITSYKEVSMVADALEFGEASANTIEFVPGSAELDADEIDKINKIVKQLKGKKDYQIKLVPNMEIRDIKSKYLADSRVKNIRGQFVKAHIPRKKIISAAPEVKKISADAVHLSNDDEKSQDGVDILVTSSRHILAIPND
jgi:hypothetical protein